jgi:disulfide bond formation protein DsbB
VAFVATLGSLFFSEVMKLPPCVLCWYQRIAMYPLAILAPMALLSKESKAFLKYAFALASLGLVIAIYHNLLYYNIIPESLTPCREGVSCTSRQIEWFGVVTIPLLSLIAFVIIEMCILWKWSRKSKL